MKNDQTANVSKICQLAEEQLLDQAPSNATPLSENEMRLLIHDLKARQIELETQNEKLRQAHAECGTARLRYEDFYDFAPVGYLTVSNIGLILEANLTAANLLNVPQDKLIGQPLDCFIFPDDENIYRNHLTQLLNANKSHVCELRVFTGLTPLWVRMETTVVQGFADEKRFFRTFICNINESKKIEGVLRESEERFRSLLENIPSVSVQGYNSERQVIFWNSASEVLYGYSQEEALGNQLEMLIIPEEMRPAVISAVDNWMNNGVPILSGELVLQRKDGSPVFVYSSHVMQKNYLGELEMYCVDIDFTERMLLEDQLRQSQKMEAVGQLAGGVAHDFNNILQVINGYGSLLKMDDTLNDQHKERLEYILSAAEKAAQLTNGLLAFSRKQVMNLQNVDLNVIVQQVLKFIARIIGEDIQVNSTLKGVNLSVKIDSGQIEQVLINLATNARDAMPKGGVLTIETGLRVIEGVFKHEHGYGEPGQYACIEVSDTGSGMDEKTRERIFEPFFTTKDVGRGTGLGMSIIYGIVKQHNGFISVCSEPGQGTSFVIYIPVVEAEKIEQTEKKVFAPSEGGSETILLAEDDHHVRKLVSTVLTESGYNVIQAEDGQDAINKFSENQSKISLILMDMIMPKKNGKEAYEAINRIKPDVNVLYLSGHTATFIKSRGVDDAGIELIMKPVQSVELLQKIREMLEK